MCSRQRIDKGKLRAIHFPQGNNMIFFNFNEAKFYPNYLQSSFSMPTVSQVTWLADFLLSWLQQPMTPNIWKTTRITTRMYRMNLQEESARKNSSRQCSPYTGYKRPRSRDVNCYLECNYLTMISILLFSFDVQCIGRIKRADMKIVLYHIIRVSLELN